MNASLRDPSGQVCMVDGRVIRFINEAGMTDFAAFQNTAASRHFVENSKLVSTSVVDDLDLEQILRNQNARALYTNMQVSAVVEHERVPFASFPYEWPAEMLHAAASLTLDLAQKLLHEGMGLKDATPFNVLFRGPEPVFVDLLSFEARNQADPTWLPYAQFARTFLLPLLANKYFGLPLDQIFMLNRDGLEPEGMLKLCGPIRRWLPPFLSLVTIPARLSARAAGNEPQLYRARTTTNRAKAQFILARMLQSARRQLKHVAPESDTSSRWSDYMSHKDYSEDYFPVKEAFVRCALNDKAPRRVLDVGCNTGFFSELAARNGASVVAVDVDPVVAGRVWRNAKENVLDILPLVINIARPTPGTGWRNGECASFLDRTRGSFDMVFMLAVVHHLLVSERIPLAEIAKLSADLTTDQLVVEFVPPEDRMFQRIARGRDHLFSGLTKSVFEQTYKRHFEVLNCKQVGQTNRWLYLMRKITVNNNA